MVFKNINCYRQHGSHVFACFIDFTKAFDSVDYYLGSFENRAPLYKLRK